MKSFKQFAEDGAAGVGTGVAGVAGAGDDKNTVPVSKKMQKKYVAAAMGEQNDPDSQQQREKSKMSADVKQRKQNLDENKFEHQKIQDKEKNKLEKEKNSIAKAKSNQNKK